MSYDGQDRGDADAYARYFAGMDKTMQQKLAFVAGHVLLDPGARVADMGCGSGFGSYQLALVNPAIRVIGVDINAESIAQARARYRLPNLDFVEGDAGQSLFAGAPLDGILTSSTLHHIYTFNGYDRAAVTRALAAHLSDLRDGGLLIIRDFVAPPTPEMVLLEVEDAATDRLSFTGMSDADLLAAFALTARPLDQRAGPGFFLEEVTCAHAGWRRFRLPHKWAAEFALRKDYREDWETELLEEYTYFTADEFVSTLSALGARVVRGGPYWNPWIVANRFAGRFRLTDEMDRPLPWPATNFVAAAQRVPRRASLRLTEKRPAAASPSYLKLTAAVDTMTGQVFDLVQRPGPVTDLLPWRISDDGRLRIVARHGYPRPIVNAVPRGTPNLEADHRSGHVVEPISVASPVTEGPEMDMALAARAGLERQCVDAVTDGLTYYPSPGGIDEQVSSRFVHLTADLPETLVDPAVSGLSTAGSVRMIDAQSLLRATQVGMLAEARLALNIYALMADHGIAPEPWIGDAVVPKVRPAGHSPLLKAHLADLLSGDGDRRFRLTDDRAGYLRVVRSTFVDQTVEDGLATTLAAEDREFVLPAATSANTAVILPHLTDADGTVRVGLERQVLPVPQFRGGDGRILTAPALRLPPSLSTLDAVAVHTRQALLLPDDAAVVRLGASYFASVGLTPERVFVFAADASAAAPGELVYVAIDELLAGRRHLRDGHLLISLFRLAHALAIRLEVQAVTTSA